MLKTFALIARRPDITRDAFREHYEEIHSPLALPLFEGLDRYVKYHLERDLVGHADFDVISTFWYESAERAIASQQRFDGPEGEPIKRDEATFMDQPRARILPVVEETLIDGDEGGEGSEQSFVFVKAPESGAEAYFADFAECQWPALRDAFGDPSFAQRQQVLLPDAPLAHVVYQVRGAPDADAISRWAQAETQRGASLLAITTRLYESPADASLA